MLSWLNDFVAQGGAIIRELKRGTPDARFRIKSFSKRLIQLAIIYGEIKTGGMDEKIIGRQYA
jgi:hypothetical protein